MKFSEGIAGRWKSKPVDIDALDDASIASSSVYTASIKAGSKLLPKAELEKEDKRAINDDEASRASTIDTRKSIQSRMFHFKRNTKETFYSADGESFTGSTADYDDYDIADIEKQLQDIKCSSPALKKEHSQLKICESSTKMEQAPTGVSINKEKDSKLIERCWRFCIKRESMNHFKCASILVFISCILFIVSAALLLHSFRNDEPTTETPMASPNLIPLAVTMVPTTSPISKNTLAPTLENTKVLNEDEPTDDECVDDMTGLFEVGPDYQDCTYLASHPEMQELYCSPRFDEVYDLCKKTCKKC